MPDPAEFEEREDLSRTERARMSESIRLKAALVHEIIREEGEEELARSVGALAWSGLAAGLSMGFSLVVEGLLHHYLPDAGWRPLVASFGYTTGFVIVVLGRQELFTESTLTGVIPVLTRRDRATSLALARLWSVVLVANLIGAGLFAALAAGAPIFEPNLHQDFLGIGERAAAGSFVVLFVKAVLAGWLIALMVWLLPGAGSARLIVILLITYIVALGGFAHIIAGSVDVLYLVLSGEKSSSPISLIIWCLSCSATSSAGALSWPCSTMPRCIRRCRPRRGRLTAAKGDAAAQAGPTSSCATSRSTA